MHLDEPTPVIAVPAKQLETRPFIAWDGEGINLRGDGKPQSYVLFGCSEGHIADPKGLTIWNCLEYIISIGERFPNAFHVGFAFSYDVNMIIQHLSPNTLLRLHRNGWVRVRHWETTYVLRFAKGKWFSVTRLAPGYDRKKRNHDKITVRIDDIFSFFATSFIKAYESVIGEVPDIIRTGKANRSVFTVDEFDDVLSYWSVEIQMLRQLADELRRRVYGAGLRIKDWHGPGALASFSMRGHGIKNHMTESPGEVKMAARYGYAGGRFRVVQSGTGAGSYLQYRHQFRISSCDCEVA
jgi:hypothetical protein